MLVCEIKSAPSAATLKGFSRGLGVVKGEAKVLLSFVASQTMIYIVLLSRYSAAKKALPFPLNIKNKFKNLNFLKLKILVKIRSLKWGTHEVGL